MYERLLELIKEAMPEIDIGKANEESRLVEDLGFDSLAIMMLAMSLEDEFGVHFDKPEHFVTVKDVLVYLEKNATKK